MKKIFSIIGVIILISAAGWQFWLKDYLAHNSSQKMLIAGETVRMNTQNNSVTDADTDISEKDSQSVETVEVKNVEYTIESVVTGLQVPWDFVFLPDGKMLITERPGTIRVVDNGQLQTEPVFTVPDLKAQSEAGQMGMALDPDFSQNRFIYICWAYENNGQMLNKVVRLKESQGKFTQDVAILDEIPSALNHAGCRLDIGPDQKLYVTTGDATEKNLAQDINSLAGKILRLNLDGTVPADNPISNNPVYSLGHRNPQGIAWHPIYNYLISTEHGPSVFDGPAGGDEVNWIQAGHNYGWPIVSHTNSATGMDDPLIVFTPAEAPASGTFYTGDVIPEFKNNFFFGALKGEGIIRVVFADTATPKVILYEKLPQIQVGRIRTIKNAPDGSLYFTTSNRDGRGSAKTGDDQIYRLAK